MSSFVPIATPLWTIIAKNLGAAMRNCDFSSVTTRNCDFFIVVARNYVAIFRNYGSQCDRSYGVTAPQFHRNETHGEYLMTKNIWTIFETMALRPAVKPPEIPKSLERVNKKLWRFSSVYEQQIDAHFSYFDKNSIGNILNSCIERKIDVEISDPLVLHQLYFEKRNQT